MHGVHAANQTNNHFATAHMQAQESAHSFSKQKKLAHITSAHAKNRAMHLIVTAVIKNNCGTTFVLMLLQRTHSVITSKHESHENTFNHHRHH